MADNHNRLSVFPKWVVTHSNTVEQTWCNHKCNRAQWNLFSRVRDHHPKKNYFKATETFGLLYQNDHIKSEYFCKKEYFDPNANAFLLLFFQIFQIGIWKSKTGYYRNFLPTALDSILRIYLYCWSLYIVETLFILILKKSDLSSALMYRNKAF